MRRLQLDLFLKKIDIIQFLHETDHLDSIEIAYILNDHPRVIETYYNNIFSSKKIIKNMEKIKNERSGEDEVI